MAADAPPVPSRSLWLWPALAWLALVPLYLRPNVCWYHDGVMNAAYVLHGDWALRVHPHHLLYNTTIWTLRELLGMIGIDGHPLTLMSILGRLAALGCVIQVGRILARHGLSPGWIGAGMLLFGTAFTTWAYATNAAVYLPALFWCLTIYLGLLEDAPLRRLALWFLLAVVFHQLALVVLVPVLAMRSDRLRTALWLLIPVCAVYLIAFVAVYGVAPLAHPQYLVQWLTRYGRFENHWAWNQGADVIRWIKTVVESHGRLVWAMPFGERFGTASPEPLPRETFWWAMKLVEPVVLGLAVWGFVSHPAPPPQPPSSTSRVGGSDQRLLALAWIVPFFVFSLVFEPKNSFYRLYYLVPLLVLVLRALASRPIAGRDESRPYHNQAEVEEKPAFGPPTSRSAFGIQLAAPGLVGLFLGWTLYVNWSYGWQPWAQLDANPKFRDIHRLNELPPGPIVFQAVGEQFEEYMYAWIYIDRPVYHSQWFNDWTYELSRFNGTPASERITASAAIAAQLPGLCVEETPLLLEREAAWDPRPGDRLHPIVRLYQRQPDRAEPAEMWINHAQFPEAGEAQLGAYTFWCFGPMGESPYER